MKDLTGLGWHHFNSDSMAFFKEMSQVSKKNYPETLRRLYLVNTPALFTMMWKIITPMLDASTLKKVDYLLEIFLICQTQILGSNFLDIVTQDIDIEVIPSNLGGKGPAITGGGPYFNPGETQAYATICDFLKISALLLRINGNKRLFLALVSLKKRLL